MFVIIINFGYLRVESQLILTNLENHHFITFIYIYISIILMYGYRKNLYTIGLYIVQFKCIFMYQYCTVILARVYKCINHG